jgi:hypothetical protein
LSKITDRASEVSQVGPRRRLAEAISKTNPLHTLDQILEHVSGRPDR